MELLSNPWFIVTIVILIVSVLFKILSLIMRLKKRSFFDQLLDKNVHIPPRMPPNENDQNQNDKSKTDNP